MHDAEEAPQTNTWCEDVTHGVVEYPACLLAHTARPLGVHSTTDPTEPLVEPTTSVVESYS